MIALDLLNVGLRMRRALIVLSLVVPSAGSAQVPTIIPGARVQVETRQVARIEGTVMAQTADSMTIAAAGAIRTMVPLASITSIRVSEGKSRGVGAIRGLKIGGAIGAGLGVLVGVYVANLENDASSVLPATAFYTAGGILWGAAIGGAVGAEKWTAVYSVPMRISSIRAGPSAAGLGVSIRF